MLRRCWPSYAPPFVRSEGWLAELQHQDFSGDQIHDALANFSPVWESLTATERQRLLQLLLQQVTYFSEQGEMAITFRPSGIKSIETEVRA